MLKISRKIGETVVINDNISITVAQVNADTVMLHINDDAAHPTSTGVVKLGIGHALRVIDSVEVSLCDIQRNDGSVKVRLGVEAPQGVSVHRREVYEAIERNRRQLIDDANPTPQIAAAFDSGLSSVDIEHCLEYLSLLYRDRGGVGLKVIGSGAVAFDPAEVPNGF